MSNFFESLINNLNLFDIFVAIILFIVLYNVF